jgi:hypothetical protein
MPNDRELALMVWYLIVIGAVIVKSSDIRRSTWRLPRVVLHWKIAVSLIGTLAYICLEGWAGFQLGIWGWSLTTDTAFWCFGVALVALLNVSGATEERHWFRKAILESLGAATLFSFLVNVFSFDLWIELLFVPFMITAGLVLLVARAQPDQQQAIRPLRGILLSVSIALAGRTVLLALLDWRTIDHTALLDALLMPIWMIIGFIPWLYIIALVSQYEQILLEIRFSGIEERPVARWAKVALLRTLGVRLSKLSQFDGPWPAGLARADYAAARSILRDVHPGEIPAKEDEPIVEPPLTNREDVRSVRLAKFWAGGILSASIELALRAGTESPPPAE